MCLGPLMVRVCRSLAALVQPTSWGRLQYGTTPRKSSLVCAYSVEFSLAFAALMAKVGKYRRTTYLLT